jgi:hypothetical protein
MRKPNVRSTSNEESDRFSSKERGKKYRDTTDVISKILPSIAFLFSPTAPGWACYRGQGFSIVLLPFF